MNINVDRKIEKLIQETEEKSASLWDTVKEMGGKLAKGAKEAWTEKPKIDPESLRAGSLPTSEIPKDLEDHLN